MNYCNNNDNNNNNDNKNFKINSCYKLFQIEFEMLPIDDIFISFYILRFPVKSSKVWKFFVIS